jgi:hypothetical protein
VSDLAAPMTGDGCSAMPFREEHRATPKAACAEETDVWQLLLVEFRARALQRQP